MDSPTTITLLNAARKIDPTTKDLKGKIFVSSGLGGMSGAQAKAAVIAKGICIIAEVNYKAIEKRKNQGWVDEIFNNIDSLINRSVYAKNKKENVSLAYHGNIVNLLEKLVEQARRMKNHSTEAYILYFLFLNLSDDDKDKSENRLEQIFSEHNDLKPSWTYIGYQNIKGVQTFLLNP